MTSSVSILERSRFPRGWLGDVIEWISMENATRMPFIHSWIVPSLSSSVSSTDLLVPLIGEKRTRSRRATRRRSTLIIDLSRLSISLCSITSLRIKGGCRGFWVGVGVAGGGAPLKISHPATLPPLPHPLPVRRVGGYESENEQVNRQVSLVITYDGFYWVLLGFISFY